MAERWNRTLKEQAIHGRIFQNLEAVRAAVADFVERYNQTWRLEKLGYQTPIEAREAYELRQAASHKCVSREPGAVQALLPRLLPSSDEKVSRSPLLPKKRPMSLGQLQDLPGRRRRDPGKRFLVHGGSIRDTGSIRSWSAH